MTTELEEIKKEIRRRHANDYPDTVITIKWDRLKTSKTPTGLPLKWAYAYLSAPGYNPKRFTLTICDGIWRFN